MVLIKMVVTLEHQVVSTVVVVEVEINDSGIVGIGGEPRIFREILNKSDAQRTATDRQRRLSTTGVGQSINNAGIRIEAPGRIRQGDRDWRKGVVGVSYLGAHTFVVD